MGQRHAAALPHETNRGAHEADATPKTALAAAGDAALARIIADKPPSPTRLSSVELCKRPAELGPLKPFVDHWWLRGPGFEAGMGPRGGGVPGDKGAIVPKTSQTTINDHTGRGDLPGSRCVPVEEAGQGWANVDASCVKDQMSIGRDTGTWIPTQNDCHTVVEQVMDSCSHNLIDGQAMSPNPEPVDAGVSP